MSDNFYKHWFRGLDTALAEMDERGADLVMAHCGRACSESFSRRVYLEQFANARDLDDFLDKLNTAFADMDARRLSANEIEINYAFCTCDLVRDGHIKSPKLCRCSLKSLQYNWESVLGAGKVACRMEQSILGGAQSCRFIVTLL